MPGRLRWLWYEFWYGIVMAGFTLGFSFRMEGRRNIPPDGPVLLIANHESFIDPLLVGIASRRHLWYLARKNVFKGLLGWFLPTVNTIPVDQEGVAKEGLKAMVDLLQAGKPALIFPEGARAWDGVMQPFKPGVLLLIKKTAPPIVPVGVAGAFEALPRGRRLPIPTPSPLFLPPGRSTVAVVVGKPIDSRRFADLSREQALAELFNEVKKVQERAEHLRRK
jgi:1-acyl-sn-glycerol-3-phosphate acyltransferase